MTSAPAFFKEFPNRHFLSSGSRWSFSFDVDTEKKHRWPHYQPYPFSLAYATSILRKYNPSHEVVAFDACAEDMDERDFFQRLMRVAPDRLIVEVPTITFDLTEQLLKDVFNVMGFPKSGEKCDIQVAGPHVTALPHSSSFKTLLGDWDNLNLGIPFEHYPHPDRTYFPNEQYSNFEFYRPSAQMITSRGCPHSCTFCIERHVIYGCNTVRFRHQKDVVDEMQSLVEQGVKQIYFDDMSITSYKNHIEGICSEILRRGLKVPWTCMGDILVEKEALRLMSKAGCLGMAVGIETINSKALQQIGKNFISKDGIAEAIKNMRDAGIHSVATFSLGLPGETEQTLRETIDYAIHDLGADSVQFSIATPFPGTPFYRYCGGKGLLTTNDWTMYDGARNCVVDYPELKHGQVEELYKYAMKLRDEAGLGFRK